MCAHILSFPTLRPGKRREKRMDFYSLRFSPRFPAGIWAFPGVPTGTYFFLKDRTTLDFVKQNLSGVHTRRVKSKQKEL